MKRVVMSTGLIVAVTIGTIRSADRDEPIMYNGGPQHTGVYRTEPLRELTGVKWTYETTGDVGAAVRETLTTTGSAMLVTSVVLTLSFGIFVFGYLTGIVQVGLLTAFATVIAFLADALVAPALLRLAVGGRRSLH